MMNKSFKEACEDMTELIISCWDENNPNDGKTFDERLEEKRATLKGQDKVVMNEIMRGV